jgi:23S rRNA pseudouridine1911/1915/1917 synthase
VNEKRVIIQFEEQEALRLDKFLVSSLPDYSRSRIQSFIKDGLVLVNGIPAHKGGQILDRPAAIEVLIPAPTPTSLIPEAIRWRLYLRIRLLDVNKPAGMVVHRLSDMLLEYLHAALATPRY